MGEELQETGLVDEIITFIPSHLTKGLVAGAISAVLAAYAMWELRQVDQEEITAFLTGGTN